MSLTNESAYVEEIRFFSVPLDPDEREERIKLKLAHAQSRYADVDFKDPYDGVINSLRSLGISKGFHELGGLHVEPWLKPTPDPEYSPMVTVENYVVFIDANGCKEYANKVSDFVKENIIPRIPCLIGVDHSLSGGCVKAICDEYGPENVHFIVLDSHFDAITSPVRCGLIQYDIETNPRTPFDPSDPYVKERPNSYNADSFIFHLVKDGLVDPANVSVFSVSDYPPKSAFEIDDDRVRTYLDAYTSLEKKGLSILRKQQIESNLGKVKQLLDRVRQKNLYVSIDIDVGANSALKGARFLDYVGLTEEEIYRVIELIRRRIRKGCSLVGFDLLETDVYGASEIHKGVKDRTYEIEANIIKRLVD